MAARHIKELAQACAALEQHDANKMLQSNLADPSLEMEAYADLARKLAEKVDAVFSRIADAAGVGSRNSDGSQYEYKRIVTDALDDLLFDIEQRASVYRTADAYRHAAE